MNCAKPCEFKKCPKVPKHGCACSPFRKVVIPAVLGDDSEDSDYAPINGAYQNALVEYQANGAMYLYSSDGIYTKLSALADGYGVATEGYVDQHDAEVLVEAKAYADEHGGGGDATREYVDQQDAATLSQAGTNAQSIATSTTNTLRSELASVAFSGAYADLSSRPSLATVATSGAYADLTGKPAVPTITMTTTDPGEGATLAENTFIGVYQ